VRYPALVQLEFPECDPLRERYEDDLRRPGKEDLDLEALVAGAREIYGSAMVVLDDAAKRSAIRLLDAAGRLESAVCSKKPAEQMEIWLGYFRDRMHLNPGGNEALAKVVADLLVENDLLKGE